MQARKFIVRCLLVGFVGMLGCEASAPFVHDSSIVPNPQFQKFEVDSYLECNGAWELMMPSDWSPLKEQWHDWLTTDFHSESGPSIPLEIERVEGLTQEGYHLEIRSDRVLLSATEEAGVFHGLTTLRLMLPQVQTDAVRLPCGVIDDYPRFEHRGLLLDCCRHFMEPDYVKRMIDLLALHKMNVLHWHLTEDQGWRIQIDAYPELTEKGAWRTEKDGTTHGGFYSKEQIREIVAYAEMRNVTIIPEIELPGHSSAALASYPWLGCTGEAMEVPNDWGVFKDIYCAGQDTTFVFLRTVLDEVMELFPSTYIHIGGDEAPKVRWEACAKCQNRMRDHGLHDEHELQSWFIGEIGQYLESHGRKMIGWDEILEGGLPEGATVQSWRGMEGGLAAVAAGHDAIMSPTSHCYFDYPVESTDMEEVYGFEPVPEGLEGEGRILGGECNMWSEHAPQALVDSKVFPRMVAMSEVLWSSKETRNWQAFQNRMDKHYDRLDAWEVDYGWETVPLSLDWRTSTDDGCIQVQFEPAMKGVGGTAVFWPVNDVRDEVAFNLQDSAVICEEGVIRVALTRNGEEMGGGLEFPIAGHVGAFKPVKIGHAINEYYPGRGVQGLSDGRLGSLDFRDGSWQAAQGENMMVEVDLEKAISIDSLSMQFYLYQDAWIFVPDSIRFQWSIDGVSWKGNWLVNSLSNGYSALEPNDAQEVIRTSYGVEEEARFIRFEAMNPGPCPDWHDAASSSTWIFMDELVVHQKH
ncbi:MAG: family 20 glycosylhydrolase [Bacteroidetes bacterium]|nr:family 20 glycosylhydrolase [Bacteroidota bacterium]MDA1335336.1 family 20 glycosylhydrolase [Bacteroidota bacterium]